MSTTNYGLSRNMKNIKIFYLNIFIFLVVKFSAYLSRHVFVMFTNYRTSMVRSYGVPIFRVYTVTIPQPIKYIKP